MAVVRWKTREVEDGGIGKEDEMGSGRSVGTGKRKKCWGKMEGTKKEVGGRRMEEWGKVVVK